MSYQPPKQRTREEITKEVQEFLKAHPDYMPSKPSMTDEELQTVLTTKNALGFMRGWSEQDIICRQFLPDTYERQFLDERIPMICTYGVSERIGALRICFTTPVPIDVSKYSAEGHFSLSKHLELLLSEGATIGADIASVFLNCNEFFLADHAELESFSHNLSERARAQVRYLRFGSNIVRGQWRLERDVSPTKRLPRDLAIASLIRTFPNLERINYCLGWDIDDSSHRDVIGLDWMLGHPRFPDFAWEREEPLPGRESAANREQIRVDDAQVLGYHRERLALARQPIVDVNMDLSW
jgi:hypothetical protein